MATVKNPLPFTAAFGVSTESLQQAGLFDPVLNIDTLLFIDPLLLAGSQHPLIRGAANDKYRQRFSQIYRLLAVRPRTDIVVSALERLVRFREIAGTCLGYTADGISGHGFGPAKSERFYAVATQVEEVGRSDPDLLPVLAVLESGIGPDLISDMTTNIIIDEIAEITKTFADQHGIPTERFSINEKEYQLPRNPCVTSRAVPVILVPHDILRDLPVANSWADVVVLAEHNAALRQRFDANVLKIMRDQRLSAPVRRERASEEIMRNSEAVARAGEHIVSLPREAYDVVDDPQSFRAIQRLVGKVERDNPAVVEFIQQPQSPEEMAVLVEQVIEQFRHLVEDKGYWKMLWNRDRRLPEATAQRIFFAIAHSYCAHYDVRIEVEHDTGEGRIDFVFSRGASIVIVVELKWSNNQGLLRGYTKQVDRYLKSERTNTAFYLVLDCDTGTKYEAFARAIAGQKNGLVSVKHVDANRRTAPSKAD